MVIFGLFQAGLEFGARHISELVRIVLLVSELDGLLQADQDILVAVKLLFELLLASLGLLDLQMERFDIALDLLDPLDDLLFEDFLAPLEITGIFFAAFVAATSIQTGASLQIYCCALDLRLGEHLDVVCISCRSGCAQLVKFHRLHGRAFADQIIRSERAAIVLMRAVQALVDIAMRLLFCSGGLNYCLRIVQLTQNLLLVLNLEIESRRRPD